MQDQALALQRTRGESSFSERSCSVCSRRRGTSEASENCEIRAGSTGRSNASEGSSVVGSRQSFDSSRGPCSCPCPRHSFDSSEHCLMFGKDRFFSRGTRASSHGSVPDVASGHVQRLLTSEQKIRSSSLPSEHSYPTEEPFCESLDRLSCEETQNGSTDQLVPQPRGFLFDPCGNCHFCAPKLPQQETKGPKPCNSVQDTSNDLNKESRDAVLRSVSSPIQIANIAVQEAFFKEESLSVPETGEPDLKSSQRSLSSLVPELSSRLSVSWRPVAFDLGFSSSELGPFEEANLFRVQASQMLDCWLSKNSCSLECKHCQEVILQRLGEAFENARRADLKDFLEHSKQT